MKRFALIFAVFATLAGCKSKGAQPSDASTTATAAGLTDLSVSLDAIRTQFNAHKQEARFLTLLSPV